MADTIGNKSTSACGGVGYVPNPPRLWSRAGGNNCLDASYNKIALDRKAEILEYKKNGAHLSQAQQYSMASRNALTRKKSWATQTQTYTNPNVNNLPEIKIPINNILSTVSLQCSSVPPPCIENVLTVDGSLTYSITYDSQSTIYTFTSGSGNVYPNRNFDVQYLIVGGGGSGGRTIFYPNPIGPGTSAGGGGGAGGVLAGSHPTLISSTPYQLSVGVGGNDSQGGNSRFDNNIAVGGGIGAQGVSFAIAVNNGGNGGSGGGASGSTTNSAVGIGGASIAGQGFPGGNSPFYGPYSGGGGGASQPGGINNPAINKGGDGILSSITGSPVYYGGGGGGYTDQSLPNGGIGGGGSGGDVFNKTNGVDGLGGGGGGGFNEPIGSGARGGNGVVILRFSRRCS